ncbi:MAG TPA: thiamine pyrophosphate-binding protein [Pseudolabrys sp.]|nr:thiamine pyrophosphate-binding protein [Pseudolabrys sp.]
MQAKSETELGDSPKRNASDVARRVADILSDAKANLVASLPDNWIAPMIRHFDADNRFRHVPVNREESAVGLCSGAFFTGAPGVALIGASGFLTCVYAITKINYTYQIPMLFLITMRGDPGDPARYHVSNGLYLRSVMDAIDIPFIDIERYDDLEKIGAAYRHMSVIGRPYVVGLSRDVLRGNR